MNIGYQRLYNQHIDGKKSEEIEELLKWMGAMQAQDYHQSIWAIGLRMQSATVMSVEQAIAERKILRTWPMRGTIHFVPAEDAKWMLELSATRMLATTRRRREDLELDEETIKRCKELFFQALQGSKRLTRSQLMELLENAGISTKKQRGYHILWYTSQIGLICHGPMQEKQHTFVLLDEWVPNAKKLSREESLAKLAKRYFTSHGFATMQDFSWWGGLTVADAKLGLRLIEPEMISQTINEKEYWVTRDSLDSLDHIKSNPDTVHLLPGFDEYLLGYKDRSAVLDTKNASKVVPGNNGVFRPTIVVDGKIVGTWKRKLNKSSVEITLSPFTPLDDLEEKVVCEAKRFSDFIGLPLASTLVESSN